jgi:hypothetical protein
VTSKRFLILFFAAFAAVAAIVISINVYADIYGLFRPTRGRELGIYGEERIAKYLQSYRYIPENFDGVLLGSSVSVILDTRELAGYRVYNASIDGGNIADLKPIAENIFRRGELQLTIICAHRYITNDHLKKTDLMTPKQYWGALGSPQLMTAYISRLAIRHGVVSDRYDVRGTLHSGTEPDSNIVRKEIDKAVAQIQRGTPSFGNYYVDPVALTELKDLIANARSHSQRLVVFYPPIPAPVLAVRSTEFSRYRDIISGVTESSDLIVDFNRPEYEGLRIDYHNFVDPVHLSKAGATVVMSELSKVVARLDMVKRASPKEISANLELPASQK